MRHGRKKTGFTLIELLVVIAIVAILAAVLFPVLMSAKERVRQVKCLSKLTQLARAVQLYAADSFGRAPNPGSALPEMNWYGGTWGGYIYFERGQIWRYVRNREMYMCEKDIHVPAEDVMALAAERGQPDIYEWAKKDYPLSYAMNSRIGGIVMDAVRQTRQVMLLIHEGRKTINDGSYAVDRPFDRASAAHWDGTTVVYMDCHAVWKSKKELDQEKDLGLWIPVK